MFLDVWRIAEVEGTVPRPGGASRHFVENFDDISDEISCAVMRRQVQKIQQQPPSIEGCA
jgi:hypothetical protein